MKEKTNVISQEELNKKALSSPWWFFPVFPAMILLLAGIATKFYYKQDFLTSIQNMVFSILGVACLSFMVRRHYPINRKDAVSGLRRLRFFWIWFWSGCVLAGFFSLLPNTVWPFGAIFVALSLYSNPLIGFVAGSILLLYTVLLSSAGASVFYLYFLIGLFSVLLLGHNGYFESRSMDTSLEETEGKMMPRELPLLVALLLVNLFQLVVLCGGILLTLNRQLHLGQFIPIFLNLLITSLLLLGVVKIYTARELFRDRDLVLTLNDIEHPLLLKLKEKDKNAYLQCVHTSYFCGRIASKIGLNPEVMKCAGYYYRLLPANKDAREEFLIQNHFPKTVGDILREYALFLQTDEKPSVKSKECGVLLASATVVIAILSMLDKFEDSDIDTEKVIQAVFSRFEKNQNYASCELSFWEYDQMKQLFINEKLYYNFLKK